MEDDQFFTKEFCDRCGNGLVQRTMSWFNTDTICMTCSGKERKIRSCLPENGRAYEGCGYIPETVGDIKPDMPKPWIKRLYKPNKDDRALE